MNQAFGTKDRWNQKIFIYPKIEVINHANQGVLKGKNQSFEKQNYQTRIGGFGDIYGVKKGQ